MNIAINFISCKYSNEEQTMYSKSYHIEVITYDNLDENIEKLLIRFFLDIKSVYKRKIEAGILSFIVLIYFISNIIS